MRLARKNFLTLLKKRMAAKLTILMTWKKYRFLRVIKMADL
jgi:hypothetical protein